MVSCTAIRDLLSEHALGVAEQRLDGELQIGGQEHFYLETQAALASIGTALAPLGAERVHDAGGDHYA